MITTGFPALDQLTGGFAPGKGYLVYGDAIEAATALSLSFLAGGSGGRPVALVTERSPGILVEEARRYGFDLGDRLDSGGLLLFEYPANISSSTRHLADESRIVREFQNLVGKHGVDRLVFDPVTPLLFAPNPAAVAARFQKIASSFSGLGATTIYVLNSQGDTDYVTACRDAAEGVLRLDTLGSGTGKIVFEQWDAGQRHPELEFGVVAGVGLVAMGRDSRAQLSGARLARPQNHQPERRTIVAVPRFGPSSGVGVSEGYGIPRVLLIHPDNAQRSALAGVLKRSYAVEEAHGAIDGFSSLGESAPDALVLAQEMRGVAGVAIVHKLRQSGHNFPVILIGGRIRRLSDQTMLLEAGVDVCLEYPVNGRLLHLHLDNLLRRTGCVKGPPNRDPESLRATARQVVNCTTDLAMFCERAAQEVNFSQEQGLPVPVFVMHYPSGKAPLEELSSGVLMVTRSTDMVYVGTRGVAVLLPEARALEPFLARFSKSWGAGATPVIEQPRGLVQEDLAEHLVGFIAQLTGTGFTIHAGDAPRNNSQGASSNGTKL